MQEKHKRDILGTPSHETRPFLELTRNISHEFPRRIKAESIKTVPGAQQDKVLILGALSKLDEFRLSPQVRKRSRTVPGTFRNTNVENQEANEDRSQDNPHPEKGPSVYLSRHSLDSYPDEAPQSIDPIAFGRVYGCDLLTTLTSAFQLERY